MPYAVFLNFSFSNNNKFSPNGMSYIYCPGKEAALGSIVVSLTCTKYLCGAFITLCSKTQLYVCRSSINLRKAIKRN